MPQFFNLTASLKSTFWSEESSFFRKAVLVLSGVVLLALASQISIPLLPIPLTFQSATVVLIGMTYGPRYGTYVIACYLLAGACGLPLFADFSGGFIKFFGPTGGYLIGFLPAAFISGYLAQKGFAKNPVTSFIAACLGVSFIFLFGLVMLANQVGWDRAIEFGLMPFIISEPVKLIALSLFVPKLWKKI